MVLSGGEWGGAQQFGHADDGIHGGANLVADVGQELVLGAVGCFGFVLSRFSFVLSRFSFVLSRFSLVSGLPEFAVGHLQFAGPFPDAAL